MKQRLEGSMTYTQTYDADLRPAADGADHHWHYRVRVPQRWAADCPHRAGRKWFAHLLRRPPPCFLRYPHPPGVGGERRMGTLLEGRYKVRPTA